MPALLRFACVALPLWLLWGGLIAAAAPDPPGRAAQAVFALSVLLALAGSVWAAWDTLARQRGRRWHRWATLGIALAMFLAVLVVGHSIGLALAPRQP